MLCVEDSTSRAPGRALGETGEMGQRWPLESEGQIRKRECAQWSPLHHGENGAGDGNRTRITSLEGWGSSH